MHNTYSIKAPRRLSTVRMVGTKFGVDTYWQFSAKSPNVVDCVGRVEYVDHKKCSDVSTFPLPTREANHN